MPRNPNDRRNLSWHRKYGTNHEGQLPQFKATDPLCPIDIDNITMQGVTLKDFSYYHIKCPYSTQATAHSVRNNDYSSPNYFREYEVASGDLTDHATTSGIMIRWSRGAKHGWLCVDDACPYYNGTVSGSVSGERYFYL